MKFPEKIKMYVLALASENLSIKDWCPINLCRSMDRFIWYTSNYDHFKKLKIVKFIAAEFLITNWCSSFGSESTTLNQENNCYFQEHLMISGFGCPNFANPTVVIHG